MRVTGPSLPRSRLDADYLILHRPDHDGARIIRYLTHLLIAIQYIPLDTPLLIRYNCIRTRNWVIRVTVRPTTEAGGDAIPLIQLLTPTVFNLSHSALFIDDDTKTSPRRRLFPTC